MKNLGRNIIFILMFFSITLYGSVIASLDENEVYKGDVVTYNLSIIGKDISNPDIDDICGNDIISTSTSTSISMIHGDYSKSYNLRYKFIPQKSCTIESVSVNVDGKIEKSNIVKVIVKKAQQTKSDNFILSLDSSKKDIYVGEPFIVTLVLKQNKNINFVDNEFIEPDFKGFWVKKRYKAIRSEDSKYVITKVKYKIAAQRDGNLSIKPAHLRIAKRVNSRDMWGSFIPQVNWKSYFSNSLDFLVKKLPNNAKIVGDFKIKVDVDKTTIEPNEAVNVKITVIGDGNLEDISSFKPYIDGVNVFDEKVEIDGDRLTQKLAFVSDKDFNIPSFKLDFYNLKTKKVQRISTKPIYIKVKGSSKIDKELNIKKADVNAIKDVKIKTIMVVDKFYIFIAFLFGLGVGLSIFFLKNLNLKRKLFNSKIDNDKLLLIKLLNYKDIDNDVQSIVDLLEKNIYHGEKNKIDKKLLKEIISRYKIS